MTTAARLRFHRRCGCIEKREPASGWGVDFEGDIRSLAEFGFDAVKFDGCGRLCNLTMYADLMRQTGRAFEIENCHWGDCTDDDASSCPTQDWWCARRSTSSPPPPHPPPPHTHTPPTPPRPTALPPAFLRTRTLRAHDAHR